MAVYLDYWGSCSNMHELATLVTATVYLDYWGSCSNMHELATLVTATVFGLEMPQRRPLFFKTTHLDSSSSGSSHVEEGTTTASLHTGDDAAQSMSPFTCRAHVESFKFTGI
jgi:hypothetical protein